jgi:hypothetical protein
MEVGAMAINVTFLTYSSLIEKEYVKLEKLYYCRS